MKIGLFSPLYAITGIILLAVIAEVLAVFVPFYRKELHHEDASRLTPLDGLRGILCFAVMFHHGAVTHEFFGSGEWVPPSSEVYALFGPVAVSMFFCITGFLFWTRALVTGGNILPGPFFRSRFFRIAPLYLFSFACVVMVAAPHLHFTSLATLGALLKMSLLGVFTWRPIGAFRIDHINAGVAWSLQYEWAFYFALPALALLARAGKSQYIYLIFLAQFTVYGTGSATYFVTGVVAADVGRHREWSVFLRKPIFGLVIIAAVGLLFSSLSIGLGRLGLFLTSIAFIPMACGNSVFGLLTLRGLRLMGVISYSVYMLHGILIYLCRPILIRFRFAETAGVSHYWLVFYAVAIALLGICMLSYRWVEKPFIDLDKRHRTARNQSTESTVKASIEPVTPPVAATVL